MFFSFLILFIDKETQGEPHQEAHECFHGLVAAGKAQDHRCDPQQAQCRDLQGTWETLEALDGHGKAAIHGRGGAAEDTAPEGVSGLQVQAEEEGQAGVGGVLRAVHGHDAEEGGHAPAAAGQDVGRVQGHLGAQGRAQQRQAQAQVGSHSWRPAGQTEQQQAALAQAAAANNNNNNNNDDQRAVAVADGAQHGGPPRSHNGGPQAGQQQRRHRATNGAEACQTSCHRGNNSQGAPSTPPSSPSSPRRDQDGGGLSHRHRRSSRDARRREEGRGRKQLAALQQRRRVGQQQLLGLGQQLRQRLHHRVALRVRRGRRRRGQHGRRLRPLGGQHHQVMRAGGRDEVSCYPCLWTLFPPPLHSLPSLLLLLCLAKSRLSE